MIGNTLSEFVDDILTMGGPEKEFLFRGKKYILQPLCFLPAEDQQHQS